MSDSCAHFAALVGYLENEVILPQGDSELDNSNFLLGVGLRNFGWCLRLRGSSKQELHVVFRCQQAF